MWLLPISIIVFTIVIAIPLSRYMARIMDGNYQPLRPFRWFEEKLYGGPQSWKQYTVALLIFNAVLFVYGFVVLALQPVMPLNPRGLGMLAPTTIFHTVHLVHNQHEHAALFGRRGFLEFQSDLLLHSKFFHVGSGWTVCARRDYSCVTRRFTPGQLLCRYVARNCLYVSARGIRDQHGVPDPGNADDLSECLSGLDARACGNGHRQQ